MRARIRGLQTHKKKEDSAFPGSRVAVNLSGVSVEQIHRGEVLAHPGQYLPTQRLDVQFRLLRDVTSPLRHHAEVKLFIGTSETIANVRLLGTEAIHPGQTGWLQLDLQTPVVAVRGDRFIVRRPSPGETLGGGVVVDPQPEGRHKRFDSSILEALESMSQGSPADVLLQTYLALGPALVKDASVRSRLEESATKSALEELVKSGQLILLEDIGIAAEQWVSQKSSILSILGDYHKTYPLRRGMPREELKSRLKLAPRFFQSCHPQTGCGRELN